MDSFQLSSNWHQFLPSVDPRHFFSCFRMASSSWDPWPDRDTGRPSCQKIPRPSAAALGHRTTSSSTWAPSRSALNFWPGPFSRFGNIFCSLSGRRNCDGHHGKHCQSCQSVPRRADLGPCLELRAVQHGGAAGDEPELDWKAEWRFV